MKNIGSEYEITLGDHLGEYRLIQTVCGRARGVGEGCHQTRGLAGGHQGSLHAQGGLGTRLGGETATGYDEIIQLLADQRVAGNIGIVFQMDQLLRRALRIVDIV